MVNSNFQLPSEYSPSASSAPYFNYSPSDFILDLRSHQKEEESYQNGNSHNDDEEKKQVRQIIPCLYYSRGVNSIVNGITIISSLNKMHNLKFNKLVSFTAQTPSTRTMGERKTIQCIQLFTKLHVQMSRWKIWFIDAGLFTKTMFNENSKLFS